MSDKDENLVIFYGGHYYDVPPSIWKKKELQMTGTTDQFAKNAVIDTGAEVGFIPQTVVGAQPGGYSAVINLTAILKKAKQ
jgi:hypothetical protein